MFNEVKMQAPVTNTYLKTVTCDLWLVVRSKKAVARIGEYRISKHLLHYFQRQPLLVLSICVCFCKCTWKKGFRNTLIVDI